VNGQQDGKAGAVQPGGVQQPGHEPAGLLVLAHAELRFNLAQRAFGSLQRQCEFSRIELGERVADPHFGAELNRHLANDAGRFAADLGLVGRHERTGQVGVPFDIHATDGCGLDSNRSAATPAAPSSPATCRRLGGRV